MGGVRAGPAARAGLLLLDEATAHLHAGTEQALARPLSGAGGVGAAPVGRDAGVRAADAGAGGSAGGEGGGSQVSGGRSMVLVVAHRLATVREADVIVVLEAGEVRAIGTHADLLAGDALYRGLASPQFSNDG